jgi:hypothetical protein
VPQQTRIWHAPSVNCVIIKLPILSFSLLIKYFICLFIYA